MARRNIQRMARISVLLAVLLILLTFNAYACILPVPQPAGMDCSSGTEEPIRGTCDAFLEIGPHSLSTSSHAVPPGHIEWTGPVHWLPEVCALLVHTTETPPRAAPSIHCSIQTTVLRI